MSSIETKFILILGHVLLFRDFIGTIGLVSFQKFSVTNSLSISVPTITTCRYFFVLFLPLINQPFTLVRTCTFRTSKCLSYRLGWTLILGHACLWFDAYKIKIHDSIFLVEVKETNYLFVFIYKQQFLTTNYGLLGYW